MTTFILEYLPLVATLLVMACYVPQIRKIQKEKEVAVKGMAWGYWVMINMALVLMLINSVAMFIKYGTYGYMIKEIFDVALCSTVLILMVKHKPKKEAKA